MEGGVAMSAAKDQNREMLNALKWAHEALNGTQLRVRTETDANGGTVNVLESVTEAETLVIARFEQTATMDELEWLTLLLAHGGALLGLMGACKTAYGQMRERALKAEAELRDRDSAAGALRQKNQYGQARAGE